MGKVYTLGVGPGSRKRLERQDHGAKAQRQGELGRCKGENKASKQSLESRLGMEGDSAGVSSFITHPT